MIAIGLMSGTSLDGVDAALLDIRPSGSRYALSLQRFETMPFDAPLREELRAALPPAAGSVKRAAELHRALGEAFAAAAAIVAAGRRIDYVASHGQTLWHDGARGITLQLGDAFVIRERLAATVCYDFRSADCAAGGHGAPLVPYFDALLFSDAHEDRVAINLGGIANVTLLPKNGDASAFDTGPANMLLDEFVRARTGNSETMDRDGAFSARGEYDDALLGEMLADDYFGRRPPKTTGRERFGSQFLQQHAPALSRVNLHDGAATLCELTAATIASAIASGGFSPQRAIVSGGGTRNPALMARIAARLPQTRVEASGAMGVPSEAKEAMAFAVLGYETLRGRPANLPAATGAAKAVLLGAVAPYGLPALFAQIQRECRSS